MTATLSVEGDQLSPILDEELAALPERYRATYQPRLEYDIASER